MEPNFPPPPAYGPPSPPPVVPRKSGPKVLAWVISIATILGGVAAGMQIWQGMQPKPKEATKPNLNLQNPTPIWEGVSMVVPSDWILMDDAAMRADTEWLGVSESISKIDASGARIAYFKRKSQTPKEPTGFAMLIDAPNETGVTLAGMEEQMRLSREISQVRPASLGGKPALRFLQIMDAGTNPPEFLALDGTLCMNGSRIITLVGFSSPGEQAETAPWVKALVSALQLK